MTIKTHTTFAQDMMAMMNAWENIISAAKVQFPNADDEEIFQIASNAMRHTLNFQLETNDNTHY